jgi:hypothetical protein
VTFVSGQLAVRLLNISTPAHPVYAKYTPDGRAGRIGCIVQAILRRNGQEAKAGSAGKQATWEEL